MSVHFVEKCSGCGDLLAQCRCPDRNKTIRWGWCKTCTRVNAKPHARDAQRNLDEATS